MFCSRPLLPGATCAANLKTAPHHILLRWRQDQNGLARGWLQRQFALRKEPRVDTVGEQIISAGLVPVELTRRISHMAVRQRDRASAIDSVMLAKVILHLYKYATECRVDLPMVSVVWVNRISADSELLASLSCITH